MTVKYEVVITTNGEREVIDQADTFDGANYLMGEYTLVYRQFPEMKLRLEITNRSEHGGAS